jgi:hypothetical protein
VAAVVLVGWEQEVKGVNASTAHYSVTTLWAAAAVFGRFVRRHWAVESGLRWCLDVSFRGTGR